MCTTYVVYYTTFVGQSYYICGILYHKCEFPGNPYTVSTWLPHVQTFYVFWVDPAYWILNHIDHMSICLTHVLKFYVSLGDPADWIFNDIDHMSIWFPHVLTFYVSWGDLYGHIDCMSIWLHHVQKLYVSWVCLQTEFWTTLIAWVFDSFSDILYVLRWPWLYSHIDCMSIGLHHV